MKPARLRSRHRPPIPERGRLVEGPAGRASADSAKVQMNGAQLWPRGNVTRHHEPKPRCRPAEEVVSGFHRFTPPDALVRDHERWQVSWLADPCLAPPSRLPSGIIGARLAAYSCGGSHGIGPMPPRRRASPCSLLIPEGNHRGYDARGKFYPSI